MGRGSYGSELLRHMGLAPLEVLGEESPEARADRVLFQPPFSRDLCVTVRYMGAGAVIEAVVAPKGARESAMAALGLNLGTSAIPKPEPARHRRVFVPQSMVEGLVRSLRACTVRDRGAEHVRDGVGIFLERLERTRWRSAQVDAIDPAADPELLVALGQFLEVARMCLALPEDLRAIHDIEHALSSGS